MKTIPHAFWKNGALFTVGPGKVLLACEQDRVANHSNQLNNSKPKFYINDFFLKVQNPWVQFFFAEEMTTDELLDLMKEEEVVEKKIWNLGSKEMFSGQFDLLQKHISKGSLDKAVLYLFATAAVKMDPSQIKHSVRSALKSVKDGNSNLYAYWNEDKGVMGVTPEILFSYSQSREDYLTTMALAGTLRKGETFENFLNDPKELKEHACVVEGIKQALDPFGEITIQERRVLQLKHLSHLLTPIELKINRPFDFDTMVNALHPTPALGAYPHKEGREWLLDYDKIFPRQYYGAPMGVALPNQSAAHCYVGIRQVQWTQRNMSIGAGCGIVKDSQIENEWNEIHLKLESIRQSLNL